MAITNNDGGANLPSGIKATVKDSMRQIGIVRVPIPKVSIAVEIGGTVARQKDIVDKSVLAAFVEDVEEEGVDVMLDFLVGKAERDVGQEMLEMVGIWEDVIEDEDTAEGIAVVGKLTEEATTARHRDLVGDANRQPGFLRPIGHGEAG
jgi:hypothetical protein